MAPAGDQTALSPSFLIAGLGNPGPEYAGTRHNVGNMAVDKLAELLGVALIDRREGLWAEASVDGTGVGLLKPASFVNTSGRPIKNLAESLGLPSGNILIIHDDLDLDFGLVRLKQGGGSGGHRGLDSIIAALRTEDFIRIRIGIGRPPGRVDPADFVLSPFLPGEQEEMAVSIAQAADAALMVVREGLTAATNIYHRKESDTS